MTIRRFFATILYCSSFEDKKPLGQNKEVRVMPVLGSSAICQTCGRFPCLCEVIKRHQAEIDRVKDLQIKANDDFAKYGLSVGIILAYRQGLLQEQES